MALAKFDLKNNIKAEKAFNAAIGSNTTTNGDWIDLATYRSVMFTLMSQAWTDGSYVVAVEDSDEAAHADAAAVDPLYLQGTLADTTIGAANQVTTIGYSGPKRWVRFNVVSTGVTTGATLVGIADKGDPEKGPVVQGTG